MGTPSRGVTLVSNEATEGLTLSVNNGSSNISFMVSNFNSDFEHDFWDTYINIFKITKAL